MAPDWITDMAPSTQQDRIATIFLIAANLVPIIGIMVFDWDLFTVLFLYWAESAIVGGLALISIPIVTGINAGSLFLMLFFTAHFGMFMGVHLIVLVAVTAAVIPAIQGTLGSIITTFTTSSSIILFALIALTISHAYEHVNATMPRLRASENPAKQCMALPYGRVVAMHLTIFIVIIVIGILGITESRTLIVLIALKVIGDRAAMARHEPDG